MILPLIAKDAAGKTVRFPNPCAFERCKGCTREGAAQNSSQPFFCDFIFGSGHSYISFRQELTSPRNSPSRYLPPNGLWTVSDESSIAFLLAEIYVPALQPPLPPRGIFETEPGASRQALELRRDLLYTIVSRIKLLLMKPGLP